MRVAFACVVAVWSAAVSAAPGYVPFVLGRGEVAVRAAGRTLRDWRGDPADGHALLVHDPDGQWYRVRLGGGAGCVFSPGAVLLAGYGVDPTGLFGPGMWVRQSTYPYRKCRVRSTRPTATPSDKVGVSYAAEYALEPPQLLARCRKRHCG